MEYDENLKGVRFLGKFSCKFLPLTFVLVFDLISFQSHFWYEFCTWGMKRHLLDMEYPFITHLSSTFSPKNSKKFSCTNMPKVSTLNTLLDVLTFQKIPDIHIFTLHFVFTFFFGWVENKKMSSDLAVKHYCFEKWKKFGKLFPKKTPEN